MADQTLDNAEEKRSVFDSTVIELSKMKQRDESINELQEKFK